MSLLNSINPLRSPSNIDDSDDILVIRERILQAILLVTLGFGLLLLLLTLITGNLFAIPGNATTLGIALVIISLLVLLRRLSFSLRAGIFTAMIFALAIYSLITGGLENESFIILLTYTLLTALFFRFRSGIASILITVVSAGAIGYLMSNGVIPIPELMTPSASSQMGTWASMVIRYLYLASISTISFIYLVANLRQSSQEARETSIVFQAERQRMEEIIAEKSQQVEKRLIETRTIAEISRAISSILDEDKLFYQVVNSVQERLGMYYVGLFIVDEFEVNAVLRTGSGEAGEKMLAAKHQLAIGGASMIGTAIKTRTPRIALDVSEEKVRFVNPILPLTRSELALPIIVRDKAIGAISIQSTQPNAFDEDDILVFRGITDSLAVAIENARLYQRSQQDIEEIRVLNRQFVQSSWSHINTANPGSVEFISNQEQSNGSEKNMVSIPIILRDQTIGMLDLEMDQDTLTPEEQRLIEAITTQTALALENARLIEETQKRARREERINQISTNLTRTLNIDDLLRTTINELSQLPSVNEVAIHLIDDSKTA
ncbi:MAG: GAF domain-containing protein [Anaerolineae bacterium]|nr:GAF domain-containing protein [Anaerolineae bacterium]